VLRYLIKRLILVVPVLLGVSVIVFLVMVLIPGDPATAILGAYATPENLAHLREELGLDKPLIQQYLIWLGNILHGDFGRSFSLDRPVLDVVLDRLGPTLILAGSALALCTLLGLFAGVITAVKQYGWQDKLFTLLVLVGISMPAFWLGLIMLLVFAVNLQWFPASGMYAIYGGGGIGDMLYHLVLPATTLGLVATGVVARVTRSAMLEVLRQDYIRTARAKGMSERAVILRYALRNALVTVIPVIGIQAGFVIGGAVYIEAVFQWPGMGRMLVNAISTRDVLLVQGGVLVIATCYVLFNLTADILQHLIDPRIKA
jgi:peptide/nickel transport system permease protein